MVTSAALAVYLVELLKQAVAKISGDPFFEFSPKVMAALLVVANAVAVLILAVLGADGYQLPTDWVAWTKVLILAVLGALVSSALYVVGLKPFKIWSQEFYAKAKASARAKKLK
jgi:drug/metabolite transporter (DMT)-like permease